MPPRHVAPAALVAAPYSPHAIRHQRPDPPRAGHPAAVGAQAAPRFTATANVSPALDPSSSRTGVTVSSDDLSIVTTLRESVSSLTGKRSIND